MIKNNAMELSKRISLAVCALLICAAVSQAQDSPRVSARPRTQVVPMPAELAGEIPEPTGQIAFIRGGDIYIINVDGSNMQLACASGNAYGRISWAPGNREITFARRGQVEFKAPDNLGGKHRVYDIFKVVMDSVGINSSWWERITDGLGARFPEWSRDGSALLYTKDYNSFLASPDFPNYQITISDPNGSNERPLRKDYQQTDYLSINPTAGPNGSYAFIAFFEMKAQGMVIVDSSNLMPSLDEVRSQVKKETRAIAPSWSPDGSWIAYVRNDINKPAINLISPDRKQKYVIYKPTAGVAPSTNPPGWSPDSKWLTFATSDGRLWISDITGNQQTEILGPGPNLSPAWSK